MAARTSCLVVVFVAITATSLQAQSYGTLGTRRGALAGAVIGGIVGNQNNEVGAGIAIGALVGGFSGRAYGNHLDYRQQRAIYNAQQMAYMQRRGNAAQIYHYPDSQGRRVYYPSRTANYYPTRMSSTGYYTSSSLGHAPPRPVYPQQQQRYYRSY